MMHSDYLISFTQIYSFKTIYEAQYVPGSVLDAGMKIRTALGETHFTIECGPSQKTAAAAAKSLQSCRDPKI